MKHFKILFLNIQMTRLSLGNQSKGNTQMIFQKIREKTQRNHYEAWETFFIMVTK